MRIAWITFCVALLIAAYLMLIWAIVDGVTNG